MNEGDPDLLDAVRADQTVRGQAAQEAAIHESYRRAAVRLGVLLERSESERCHLRNVSILGSPNTRQSFLNQVVQPSLSAQGSLKTCLDGLAEAADKLAKFDIYESVTLDIDALPANDDLSTSTDSTLGGSNDIAATIRLKERPRLWSRAGTDIGNQEGSAYTTVHLRNVFGGAESLEASFTKGTRTRTSYEVKFQVPVDANPDSLLEASGYGANKVNAHASHDEHVQGCNLKWKHLGRWAYHEAGILYAERQICNIREGASFSVRQAAGVSKKLGIIHIISRDKRDNPILPTRGYRLRSTQEIAVPGLAGSDAGFAKLEVEGSLHTPLFSPTTRSAPPTTILNLAFRTGTMYSGTRHIHLPDRFNLGGPQSVRGFMYHGLGPRDGKDSLGGTAYLATAMSLITTLPRAPEHWPIRVHSFINTGALLDLQVHRNERNHDGQTGAWRELLVRPSVSAGIGLVFPLPMGRIELSFTLPIACRSSDRPRKGLQFGLGVEFL